MMKSLFVILIVMSVTTVSCQTFSFRPFNETESRFKIQGKFVKGINWKDNLGDNYLVLSVEGPMEKIKNSRRLDIDLYGYHFLKEGEKEKQLWLMTDSQKVCPEVMDITAKFITDGISITDLNKNGECEVWLIYKMS